MKYIKLVIVVIIVALLGMALFKFIEWQKYYCGDKSHLGIGYFIVDLPDNWSCKFDFSEYGDETGAAVFKGPPIGIDANETFAPVVVAWWEKDPPKQITKLVESGWHENSPIMKDVCESHNGTFVKTLYTIDGTAYPSRECSTSEGFLKYILYRDMFFSLTKSDYPQFREQYDNFFKGVKLNPLLD